MSHVKHSQLERMFLRQLKRRCRDLERQIDQTDNEAEKKKLQKEDELIHFVLNNGEAFQLCCEQVFAEADVVHDELEVIFYATEYPVIDALIKLFEWVLQNWDEIAKIIEYIIGLFAERGVREAKALVQ